MLGKVIGRYRLDRILGEGGMGQVFLGEHELLGRTAAVKLLSPRLSGSQEALERLFREAVATSQIRHPGIVQVYDYGYADECAFLVMEHLEGETLKTRLDREGRLPLGRALALARQIASALQGAHAVGVVHRDLKPANVFIVPDPDVAGGERIKILDFGIAKLTESESGAIDLTASGAILGTPVFMSPEQCRGEAEISDRSDIYSLGCVLFRMVAGRPPFLADTVGQLILDHCTKTPPPIGRYLDVPNSLEQLAAEMLAKEPGDRPGASRVREWLESLEDPTVPPWGVQATAAPVPFAVVPQRIPEGNTTLAAAAGVTTGGQTRARRRWWWGVGGAALVAALAGVMLAAASGPGSGGSRTAVEADAGVVAEVEPDAAAIAAAAADAAVIADAAPAPVRVVIRSKPGGAEVCLSRRGEALGETPYVLERQASAFPLTVWLRRRGYRTAKLVIDGAGELPAVDLVRRRSRPSGTDPLESM